MGVFETIGIEYITLIIIVLTLILFLIDRLPIALTAMISSLTLGLVGAMEFEQVYAGFASTLVMLVFGMMIVGHALFRTGVVIIIGRAILKTRFANNEKSLIILLMIIVGGLSAFLSNTATVATFIPLVAAMVASSGGKLTNKNILMPVGMAGSIGGTITLVGSTAQPMVNSILVEYDQETLGMFDFAWVAIPMMIVLVIYMATVGNKLQDKVYNFPDIVEKPDISSFEDFKPNSKTYIAAGTMIFAILGFATGILPIEIIALMAAVIVLVTGCIEFKDTMKSIDWNTILLMAFAQGIAAGMNDSGAGNMIAEATVSIVGDNVWLLFTAAVIITVILTNIMSNTAVAAMMAPIFIVIAVNIGYSPLVFMMGIALAANASIATPIGGTAMSQVLVGGYRFKDYVKIGLPITIILTVLIIILTPLIFGFNEL
ncbi:SLC13 family permease [Salinicoccus albus]|uniref:SLC13 family permease n=1 Tax=Salinicoccus albus TaxID=418756 RepID=UPI00037CC404|nr:SLC13 family permease [Salinicoccus albus]